MDRACALARAIAASRGWMHRDVEAIVVGGAPEPTIAAVGRFGAADVAWMGAAGAALAEVLGRTVVLDQPKVDVATEALATALRARFEDADLQGFRYVPVPRGGYAVLGRLAYLLDLPGRQLGGSPRRDETVVLVDDVIVSGSRAVRALDEIDVERAVLAVLHAHPEALLALSADHPRVVDAVAGTALHDHAPERHGAELGAWRDRWRLRTHVSARWIGLPDHVVYPWNEPDVSVWNPVAEREEPAWPVVPPEACLKHRIPHSVPVHVTAPPAGPLRAAADVLTAHVGEDVVLAHLGSGRAFGLQGVGAALWGALERYGHREPLLDELTLRFAVDRAMLIVDVERMLADLRTAGLIVDESA